MATIPQIRGMLLEESILYLIGVCGYNAVDFDQKDKTLYLRPKDKALCVRGRGENHQIDVIADFFLSPPFSHPQRLLIEAKQYKGHVGLPIVRNVVGTLKDVSEFWTAANLSVGRYHYQYAIISGSGFTPDAERFAFAHDVYLLPVHKSTYFRGLIQAIQNVNHYHFGLREKNSNANIDLKELRIAIRRKIANFGDNKLLHMEMSREAKNALDQVCQECRKIQIGLLATINGDFPLFLVPNPSRIREIADSARSGELISNDVHIRRADGGGWILRHQGEDFFSFDVPSAMLQLYTEQSSSQTSNTVEIQGLLMNLRQRIDSNFGNGMVKVNFKLPRIQLNQLMRE